MRGDGRLRGIGGSQPVRVLHVITPSHIGGAETLLARMLSRWSPERVQNFCVASRSRAIDDLRALGLPVDERGIGGKANVFALASLRKAAHEYRADFLHSHLSSASWWCGWLECLGGPPSIGHVHGFTSAMWHSRQTHLIANSWAVRQDLIDKGIDPERISVLHCPVDPQDQQPRRSRAGVREELGVDERTPVVGTFAHLSVKKGYRELVRAAEIVLKAMPSAQFWCVGEGVLRAELERHAAEAGIGSRFRLLGFRRDVPDVMQAIDVMCLPSHREPFGLVYVEAALAQRPVIGCRSGGAPEIIEHGESGWLVPPHSVPELAEAILTVLDDRARGEAMGRRGRQLALERFGWDDFLSRLEQLYRRLLDDQGGRRMAA